MCSGFILYQASVVRSIGAAIKLNRDNVDITINCVSNLHMLKVFRSRIFKCQLYCPQHSRAS